MKTGQEELLSTPELKVESDEEREGGHTRCLFRDKALQGTTAALVNVHADGERYAGRTERFV